MGRNLAIPIEYKPGMKVLEEVTTLENLRPRLERFTEIEKELEHQKSIQNEITTLGKYTEANGFSRDRNFQRIACIPPSVWSAVLEVFPDAAQDKRMFYALLDGPLREYDMRGKVVL